MGACPGPAPPGAAFEGPAVAVIPLTNGPPGDGIGPLGPMLLALCGPEMGLGALGPDIVTFYLIRRKYAKQN